MQRYDLIVAREGAGGKTYWTKIGAAFPAKSGEGFSLSFDALPLPSKDGGCWVQMRIPQERNAAPESPRARSTITSGRNTAMEDDDSAIPF